MAADLLADTAVRRDDDTAGRYHVTLPSNWNYVHPSGGVLMTCALRAAEAELATPVLRFASATTIFCTPIKATDLVVDVAVLRRGGATAQVRVALRERDTKLDPEDPTDNARGLELTATFMRDRLGPDVVAAISPVVAGRARPLADSIATDDEAAGNPHHRLPFFRQLETRIADGQPFWAASFEAGPPRFSRWFRYRAPQRDADGRLDRLALPPLIDTMPTALHRAIGPGPYRFYAPSLDLTTYVVDDTTAEWLLVEVTLRRARMGWAIADAEVWDEDGRLIAYGAQAMYLHGLSGEPPTLDAASR